MKNVLWIVCAAIAVSFISCNNCDMEIRLLAKVDSLQRIVNDKPINAETLRKESDALKKAGIPIAQTVPLINAQAWIYNYDQSHPVDNIFIDGLALRNIFNEVLRDENHDDRSKDKGIGVYIKKTKDLIKNREVWLAWEARKGTGNCSLPDDVWELENFACVCRPCCPTETDCIEGLSATNPKKKAK